MRTGNVYSVSFSSAAVVAAVTEPFALTASTVSNFVLREVRLGQVAAALTSSAIETLTVGIYRGSTLGSTAGATAAIYNQDARSDSTGTFATLINSSSPGSSGTSAQLLYSAPWNTQLPFVWRPPKDERPVFKLGQRLQVRLGAPAAGITVGGSVLVEEIGKTPGGTAQ